MTMRIALVWSLSVLLANAAEPSFDELLSEIRTGNTYQQRRAVSQLAGTGAPRVAGVLVDALRDKDAGQVVRISAAQELASLADPTTANALAEALTNRNHQVCPYAAEGLVKIGSRARRIEITPLLLCGRLAASAAQERQISSDAMPPTVWSCPKACRPQKSETDVSVL